MGWLSALRISQICWINQYLTSRWCSDWWISSAHLPLSSTLTTKPNAGCHKASDQYPPGEHRWAWVQPWDFSQPPQPKAGPLRRGSKHTQTWWDHILSQKSATKAKEQMRGKIKPKHTPYFLIPCLQPFLLLSSPAYRQQRVAMMPPVLLGSVVKNVSIQSGVQSPPTPLTRSKHKQLAWTCVHLRMHTCMHRNTHLPVWVGLKDRDSVSYNRWLQGLGQRASMDGKTTTAAKAERTEM